MDRADLFRRLLQRLEDDLPTYLHYHDADHTRSVIEKAEFLAAQENLSKTEVGLIRVAALYHDAGFLIGREDHETKSCDLAARELPQYGFEENEIKLICGMISATRIPQVTSNVYEKVLADADLYYLGTQTYEHYSNKLFQELKYYTPDLAKNDWLKIQYDFLRSHHFHSAFAVKFLAPQKQKHLEKIEQQFKESQK